MAHPFAKHAEHTKSHSRVAHLLKSGGCAARGGAAHGDEHEDRQLFREMMAEHEGKVEGKSRRGRFARGGKVKSKKGGHHTNIAVVVPQKTPPAGPPAGAGAPPPMPVPAPPGGGGPPPMLGPGGPGGPPPPGMPPGMSRRGGRIKRADGGKVPGGEPTKSNLDAWSARASKHSYARGGAASMTAGALSGEGRLQKAGKK